MSILRVRSAAQAAMSLLLRRATITVRLGCFYAAALAVIGVQQPFWPLWLADRGLSAADIGVVLALSVGVKVASTPAVAHLADRTGDRKRWMVMFAAIAAASFAAFAYADGFLAVVVVSLVFFAAWPPVVSLAESMTMLAARQGLADYGRARLWGSLSYIAAAALAGQALASLPTGSIYWMVFAALVAALLACVTAPDLRAQPSAGGGLPIAAVLKSAGLVPFLLACGLIQGSHAVYYGFATLQWRAVGFSGPLIGGLWALGVLAEVVLFAYGRRLMQEASPLALIAVGGFAATARWLGAGATDALPAVVALQILHAFSFGAAHLAAMHHLSETVAPALSATAQSLYSGVVWGLFLGGMMFVAGALYADVGQRAYFAMAIASGAGGMVAAALAFSSRRVRS